MKVVIKRSRHLSVVSLSLGGLKGCNKDVEFKDVRDQSSYVRNYGSCENKAGKKMACTGLEPMTLCEFA